MPARLVCQPGAVRALVQRVERAAVDIVGPTVDAVDAVDAVVAVDAAGGRERVGAIGPGLCVLVGVTHDDTAATAGRLAERIWYLRVLDDEAGVMNRSLADRHAAGERAEVLAVSQFTLYGSTDRGRRPSWIAAARPEVAEPLVDRVVARLRELGATVATGRFRHQMRVEIVNDGPVTVMLEI